MSLVRLNGCPPFRIEYSTRWTYVPAEKSTLREYHDSGVARNLSVSRCDIINCYLVSVLSVRIGCYILRDRAQNNKYIKTVIHLSQARVLKHIREKQDYTGRIRYPSIILTHIMALHDQHPSLNDVLHNTAPHPYTFNSFTAHLSRRHCLEILEFILEARCYRDSYETTPLADESLISSNRPKSWILLELWQQLLSTYIIPGSPRELNLRSNIRCGLLGHHNPEKPPAPTALDAAEKEMHELLSHSIFPSFLNDSISNITTGPDSLQTNVTDSVSPTVLSLYNSQEKTSSGFNLDTMCANDKESCIHVREPEARFSKSSKPLLLGCFSKSWTCAWHQKLKKKWATGEFWYNCFGVHC